VQALLAAAFLAAGGLKLAGVPQMVALFDQIGLGAWFRYFTGAVEVAAALALLVKRTVAYAAGVLLATMVCAVAVHLFFIGGSPLPAVVLATLSGLVAYRRWPRT
jgi:putative oxidoreductase